MLTIREKHYIKADIDRLDVPRKEGGRGPIQIAVTYTAEAMTLMEYVESKEDPLMQIVRTHQHHTN
jgi:hypothetical protein